MSKGINRSNSSPTNSNKTSIAKTTNKTTNSFSTKSKVGKQPASNRNSTYSQKTKLDNSKRNYKGNQPNINGRLVKSSTKGRTKSKINPSLSAGQKRYKQNRITEERAIQSATKYYTKKGFQLLPNHGMPGNGKGNDLALFHQSTGKFKFPEIKGSANRIPPKSRAKTYFRTETNSKGLKQGTVPYAIHNLRYTSRLSNDPATRRAAETALMNYKKNPSSIQGGLFRHNSKDNNFKVSKYQKYSKPGKSLT